jgi:predicted alpha/beta-fold hydrolase
LIVMADNGTVRLVWEVPSFVAWDVPPHGVVLLLPGLNNHSGWAYIRHASAMFCERGFIAATLDYRGINGLPVTGDIPKIGCMESWRDVGPVLAHIAAQFPRSPLFAVGFSMGGSMLAKYLAETGEAAVLRAAATVAAPLDTVAAARELDESRLGRLLSAAATGMIKGALLRTAAFDAATRRKLTDGGLRWGAMLRAQSLTAVEAAVICPLHGYDSPQAYHRANNPMTAPAGSRLRGLQRIAVPTLCIHARDDPMIRVAQLPVAEVRRNKRLLLVLTERGGHLGYVAGGGSGPPGSEGVRPTWADELCHHFFAHYCYGRHHQRGTVRSKL